MTPLGERLFVDEVEALLLVEVTTAATVTTGLVASSVDVGALSDAEEDREACKMTDEDEGVLIALSEFEAEGL